MTKKLSKCKPRHIPIDLEITPEINLCINKPKIHIRQRRCKTKCHHRSQHKHKHKRKSKCKCKCKCKCKDEDSSYYSSSDFSDSHAIL
jgi:hypothetical protein